MTAHDRIRLTGLLREGPRRRGPFYVHGVLTATGDGKSRACVYVPYKRRPVPTRALIGDAIAQRDATAPVELYGTADGSIESVFIRHHSTDGGWDHSAATLVRASFKAELESLPRTVLIFGDE